MISILKSLSRALAALVILAGLSGTAWTAQAHTPPAAQRFNLGPGVLTDAPAQDPPPPGLVNASDYNISSGPLSPEAQVFAFQPGQNPPAALPQASPNQVAAQPSPASLDSSAAAGVDDRENSDVTGWAVYEHLTLAQVVSTATNNNWRVVDLFVETTANPNLFTATYVANGGSYARGWWLLANVNANDLLTFVLTNSARIIVMKTVDNPALAGETRFYAVMIPNTGADAKSWWFYQGKTTAELTALWQTNNARIVQVNSFVQGGVTKYSAVMISNTGADARSWWWYVNASVSDLVNHLNANNARLIDLDIDFTTGNYNAVMTGCSGGCPLWWWYVGISTSDLLNISLQNGARIIDANSVGGCGDRCWSFVLINNSNAITTRVGQLLRNGTDGTKGLYLKQINGPVLANLMDGSVFEPASTIKVAVHLFTARALQAGTVTQNTAIPRYLPPASGSCPGITTNGSETILTADQEMMFHSDNTRTRELADYFGTTNINLMLSSLGAVHTAINHVIGCGGPPENQTTLDDLGLIYEGVANAALVNPLYRDYFFRHEAGKAQYQAEGYDWTGLWSSDIPNLINQEAPVGMTQAAKDSFKKQMDLAYKAGNYKICTNNNCTTYKDHISIFGYALIPSCHAAAKQFVFGTYIYNSSSDANSSSTFTATKAELLREQIHNGLATWTPCTYSTFIPSVVQ